MFAGLTVSAMIGGLGGAVQVLAMLTFLLYKLDEMLAALRRVVSNAKDNAVSSQAAAKITALDIQVQKVEAAADAAASDLDRALERLSIAEETAALVKFNTDAQRAQILQTRPTRSTQA